DHVKRRARLTSKGWRAVRQLGNRREQLGTQGPPDPTIGVAHLFVRWYVRAILSRRLRLLAPPFLVEPPTGARIRTRLRVSAQDALVLWALGLSLGCLANQDLAVRCALGNAGGDGRVERTRALTPG